MVVDNILTNIPTPLMTFGSSTVAGFFIGMAIKRIFHIVLIIVGSFLGVLFLAIQFMSHKGYLGNAQIDWDKIGTDIMAWFQSVAAHFSSQHIFGVLGIPATSGLAAGILLGITKG
jgi:uncharacterized membrane protein (Fun14 family)